MNIRPKNEILFALTGVKFTLNNLGGANWRQQVFNNYRLHLLDLLTKSGLDDGYAYWLNDMQSRHSKLYNSANASGDWLKKAYKSEDVGKYLHDYKGDLRFGTYNPRNEYKVDFNQLGIVKALELNRYDTSGPVRTSGDYGNHDFKVDNLYSAITDDRRLLGRKGDWDENSEEYKLWLSDLNKSGWETYLDTNDNYYKLRRLNIPPSSTPLKNVEQKLTGINPAETKDKESIWGNVLSSIKGQAPNLIEALRLGINLNNNKRIFDTMMQAIRPNLLLSYNTHRQIVGDEATKLGFYRRAALGESKVAKPFTSDADRQMAYMMEAKRVGDELRAQGDLADNQEIRRTSDESNQHQWANVQRDTEVANHNTIELNLANAAKRLLEALKYSADTSSWDNYLMSIENRIRQLDLKKESVEDLIKSLLMQDDLDNDPEYRNAYTALETAIKNNTSSSRQINWEAPEVKQAQLNLLKIKRQAYIKYFKIYYGKRGTKMEYSRDDKYLYKTSRDIVDHFRKMTKITDDSRIRTRGRTVKLSPHPKKYQLGGVAPYTVFRPVSLMGPSMGTTTSNGSSAKSTSSKEDPAKNKLDMVKELFKSIQGLPIDTDLVYSELDNLFKRYLAFGQEMSTDDITSIYLRAMLRISHLKYSQSEYDKALLVATSNDALGEFAVGADGEIVVQNLDTGEIKKTTLNQFKNLEGRWNPLKNSLLLTARAHSKNFAFDDTIFNIVNNGIGLSKIANHIKSLAGSLSVPERKLEGISEVLAGRVKNGLQVFSGFSETPDGYYKISQDIKDPNSTVSAALKYIYGILPENYKTILKLHAGGDEGAKDLIISFLTSQTSASYKEDIAPLTGQASDKDKETSIDKLGINSAVLLLLGMSSPREFSFNIGNGNSFEGAARVSSITKEGNPVGSDFSYSEVYKSDLHKNLDLDNACFGDVPINKALKDRIIVDNSTIAGVDLPYTTDKNGRIIPDFNMLNKIEEADLEILRAGINPDAEPLKANEIYAKHGLPIKYGANNKLTGNYKRFAVIQATAIEDVFLNKDGISSNGTLTLVSDENEVEKYKEELKKITGQKEIDMDRPGLFTGNKDIYKGSIFIPIIGDLVDAVSATGQLKAGMYDDLRSKYNTKNYNQAPLLVKQ